MKKTILVTGAAGFIGYHLANKLVKLGHHIVALDNLNNYYDKQLKLDRLKELGFLKNDVEKYNSLVKSSIYNDKISFINIDLSDSKTLYDLFKIFNFQIIYNLAAQAGVRYSLDNPKVYIQSNINGFFNLIDIARKNNIERFIYASSSSIYGNETQTPFNENFKVDKPISLYAASKKTNELIAHAYTHLYKMETIGLRFFTVYGPWGRPDMAYYLFTDAVTKNNPIKVFNNGNLMRDFTYIDDIIDGLVLTLLKKSKSKKKYKLYNLGFGKPINLLKFIQIIEDETGKTTDKIMMPMQKGDVEKTWADTTEFNSDYGFKPKVNLNFGVKKFVEWYNSYVK